MPGILTVVGLAAGPVRGQPPCGATPAVDGIPESTEAADRLLRRLGSGSREDRDAAERDLLALGPAVLPWVAAARLTATGEAAFRLAGIQRWLERRAADEAVEPATVTFSADDLPPTNILRELFERTGSSIDIAPTATEDPAVARRMSVRCDRMTFWEAIGDVLDRSGLTLDFHAAQPLEVAGRKPLPTLSIVAAARAAGPAAPATAAGPLRVSIAATERTGPTPADVTQDRPRGARITLRVAWEPRQHPVLMRLPARSLVAEGPGGEALPPQQQAAVIEVTIPPGGAWVDLPVLLAPPAVPVDEVATLRGTLIVWLTGRDHTFSFTGLRPDRVPVVDRPARVAGAEVRLVEARFDDERLLVRAAVAYDAPSEALASHHSWLAARGLEACTADGQRLARIDQELTARTDRGATVTAEFALPSAPGAMRSVDRVDQQEVGIRWTLPITIHEEPVDFMLRHVALTSSQPR